MKNTTNSRLCLLVAMIVSGGLLFSCESKKKAAEDDVVVEEVIVEEDFWVVDEHQMNNIPLTSAAEAADQAEADIQESATEDAAASEKEMTEAAESELEGDVEDEMAEAEEYEYEIAQAEALEEDMLEAEYIAETTVEVTEVAIPLDETQTVVAYNKKGDPTSMVQVISTPDGEVEQVIFQDKKHKDVYDVQAGMTGKEAKQLRKELKHMVHKGQVFLYDEASNIMYLTDIQNMAGDEITDADIESSEVTAIIWKDKKHHKKMKENS